MFFHNFLGKFCLENTSDCLLVTMELGLHTQVKKTKTCPRNAHENCPSVKLPLFVCHMAFLIESRQ